MNEEELKKLWNDSEKDITLSFRMRKELLETDFLDLHYSFIKEEDANSRHVWLGYEKRGCDGFTFLQEKLMEEQDDTIKGEIILMMGRIVNRALLNNKPCHCHQSALGIVRDYFKNGGDIEREKAVIVLGWIGELSDIEKIGSAMLSDSAPLVRTWSASAIMQKYFRSSDVEKTEIRKKSMSYYLEAIRTEADPFATGVMIESIGEVFEKKFRLSRKAIDDIDTEKIEKTRKSVLNYLEKNKNNILL